MAEQTEEEYLKAYDKNKYDKPSVTVDILIFTINQNQKLELLMVKRGGHPYKGKWAVPGGFINMDESLEQSALRELQEETGVSDIYLEQLYTFGDVGRDPRDRIISIAYMAMTPKNNLQIEAGDDADRATLFEVEEKDKKIRLIKKDEGLIIDEEELAFDHGQIIKLALDRMRGKLAYTDIALEFLKNKKKFTIYELQIIYETILGQEMDVSNFRRSFKKRYVDTGKALLLEEKSTEYSRKPCNCYRI